MTDQRRGSAKFWALFLGALGVVYGDIGTSPLYVMHECFHQEHGLPISPGNVYGILSLIVWSLVIVISLKYIVFIMRADNRGEGGILALIALISPRRSRHAGDGFVRYAIPLGIFGAALLFGDGMITPAISVLSAVEGLAVAKPVFTPFVLPLSVIFLVALFLIQKQGTARIGSLFGPVMVVWFAVLGFLGVIWIARAPEVLGAIDPRHAITLFRVNHLAGFLALGAVFLCVTGGEALYADMGHFGRRPIRVAWFTWVLPALLLNYFGQGALLLRDPSAIENPFYRMAPGWAMLPLVILSTMAAMIASQALISGVFSLAHQAVLLGYLPRLSIIHTSEEEIGQIYVPAMNWTLLAGTLWLVLAFRSSTNLASAYGLAVTGTMVITTVLAYFVARRTWRWSRARALASVAGFLVVDIAFSLANLVKVLDGGWFPLGVGVGFCFLMLTWQKGRRLVVQRVKENAIPIAKFLQRIEQTPPLRVPGAAIYMTHDPESTPLALLQNLRHNHILHSCVALLTVSVCDTPFAEEADRTHVERIGPEFFRINASYGFLETPNVNEILVRARPLGYAPSATDITFFLGKETVLAAAKPGMQLWRGRVFTLMLRNAQRATAFFRLPADQVIEVGIQVEI